MWSSRSSGCTAPWCPFWARPSSSSSPIPWGTWDKSFYIISFDDAMGAIDLNVIFLLMGMMIFVGVMKKTGMFQFLAYKAYALAKGNVFVLSFVLQIITAVISAFLDNVTTMLLVIPVTIEIAVTLKINPLTLLIPEAFATNVGGTATLIGDPPNILIGSYAGLTFGQFVAEPDPDLLHVPDGLLVFLPLVAQKGLPQGRSEGRAPHHRVSEGRVQNHQQEADDPGPDAAGLHHPALHPPRLPAHAGVDRGPDRLPGAAGHLRGGHRGDAGERGGVAHPGLLHRPVHGHRRGRRDRPDPDDRQLRAKTSPRATSPRPSSSSCG